MKKLVCGIGACATLLSILFGVVACTPLQQQAVARQLGLAAAVTWIGVDNPSSDDLTAVKAVVGVIKDACPTNGTVDSYYTVLYPVAEAYITANLKTNLQPVAKLGGAALLTSLDTAFAMNPSWKTKTDEVVAIVDAFLDGASGGLGMAPTDPVRMAATRQSALRSSLTQLKR